MDDLVSLCRECHEEAGKICKPSNKEWIVKDVKSSGNFMASMRVDAQEIAQIVYGYLLKICDNNDYKKILRFRQPSSNERRDPWHVLEKAVTALCKQRYEVYTEDRKDMAIRMISSHTMVLVCLGAIMHENRNFVQETLREGADEQKIIDKTWVNVAKKWGISTQSLSNIRKDNGSSGPTLRESVFYYCGLDALAGIRPSEKFHCCLTDDDFQMLDSIADYAVKTSGIEYLPPDKIYEEWKEETEC